MAQKIVGYREMIWTCPNCGTKNPGSSRVCRSCGAAMPEETKFEQQANADMVRDEKIIERAKRGPDIICAYCGNRNPAGSKTCSQCGADLSEGKEREHGSQHSAHLDDRPKGETIICPACGAENPAAALTCKSCGGPLNSSQQVENIPTAGGNDGRKGGMGRSCLMIILFLVIFGLVCAVFMNGCGTGNVNKNDVYSSPVPNKVLNVVVSSQSWQTSAEVLGPVDSRSSGWRDSIPANARDLRCEDRIRYTSDEEVANSVEVCGTPYAIDMGNGFEQFVQDCVYNVYESYCDYTISKTGVINTVYAYGSGPNPESPYVDPAYTTGNQLVDYKVTFRDENGETYTITPSKLNEYQSYTVGSEYKIEVNSRGQIVGMEKK